MAEFPVPVLKITIDHAQKRELHGLQTILAQGSFDATDGKRTEGWEIVGRQNVYLCPVTYNIMLKPRIYDINFWLSNTGEYQKLGVGDFAGAGAAGWVVNEKSGVGGMPFLTNDAGSAALITNSALGENQGFMVAVFNYSDGSSRQELLRFGLNDTATLAGGTGFILFNDNTVDVYRDGVFVHTGSISPRVNGGDTKPNTFMGVSVIPQRKREILVTSIPSGGGAFVYAFDDIDEDDTTPTILPAKKFWFQKVSGLPDVLVYPMKYHTSGHVISKPLAFARAPESGQVKTATVYGWFHGLTPSVDLLDNTLSPFVANGSTLSARVKVTLTGTNILSPSLYGSSVAFGVSTVDTDDDPHDISPYVPGLQIAFGETAESVLASWEVARPETLEADLSTVKIRDSAYRPVKLEAVTDAGAISFLDGHIEIDHVAHGKHPDADKVVMVARDWWHRLEAFRFRDPIPLDGLDFDDAINQLVQLVGQAPGGAPVISTTTLKLPDLSPPTAGEWSALIRAGDTVADWVKRLFQTYAPNWLYGFFPTATGVRFKATKPDDLATTPKLTLYQTRQEAIDAMVLAGVGASLAAKQSNARVFRNLVRRRRPPVATEVNVTGLNGRTGEPQFAAVKIDVLAEDPTTPVALQPANWVGGKIPFGYADALLNSQALVDAATDAFYDVLTTVRDMAQWEGEMLFDEDGVPLWRGDVVTLDGVGDYRITSMRARTALGGDGGVGVGSPGDRFEDWVSVPAVYTAEKIGEDLPAMYRGDCPEDGLEAIIRWPIVELTIRPRGVGKAVNILQQNAINVTQTKVT